MEDQKLRGLEVFLRSEDIKKVNEGLDLAETLIKEGYYSDEFVEILSMIFFIDVYEYPEWQKTVEKSAGLIGSLKMKALPKVLSLLDNADAKAAFYFAMTIGKIGVDGIDLVLQKLISTDSNFIKALMIFALGKIKDSGIKKVIPDLLPFFEDKDAEIRDSVARTLGKIFEVVKVTDIPKAEVQIVFKKLMGLVKDNESKIRGKAVHSLGKMVRFGFLENQEVQELENVILRIVGKDKNFQWDNAFIVRREANNVLPLIQEYLKK